MTAIICFLLLAAGVLLLWRGRTKWALRLSLCALVILYLVGTGLLPLLLLRTQQTDKPLASLQWGAHNSIVLLGAGTLVAQGQHGPRVPFFGYSRVETAARAYFSCRARSGDCKVIVSGGDPQKHGRTEAAVYADELQSLSIPRTDLVLEDRSNNTWQNAQNATALVPQGRSFVLVTSGFQLKRAALYFSHFRSGIQPLPSDQLAVELSPVPQSMNLFLMDALLHEQVGIARYHLYNALGWNAPKSV